MRLKQMACPLRLLIFYLLLVFFASLGFSIQDALSQGRLFPFDIQIQFIPISGGSRSFVSLLVVWLSVWIMTRFWEQRPLTSLGFLVNPPTFPYLFVGFLVGIISKAAILYTIAYHQLGLLPKWPFLVPLTHSPIEWSQFLDKIHLFLIPSAYEEILFRGYILQTLISGVSTIPAILLSAILFGILHYNYGGWMYVLNAALVGVMYSISCIKARSLWLPISLHFGFNLIGAYWPLKTEETLRFTGMKPVFGLGNPIYTLGLVIFILIFIALPLRPHPQAKALWDRYIRPATWLPWRRREESEPQELEAPGGEV